MCCVPHQNEGIASLWNCVTGVSDGLKNAFRTTVSSSNRNYSFDESEADDDAGQVGVSRNDASVGTLDDVPRGAVLADEMGLGKVRRGTSCYLVLSKFPFLPSGPTCPKKQIL